jgi:hypothetical protein
MGLEEFYGNISIENKLIFSKIAEYAVQLGYKVKKAKTQSINYVFVHNKIKKHIMKFSLEKRGPVLKLKFYASTEYSPLFREAVREVIEEFNYKYTGCYGCGKCKDSLEGYEYTFPDGRTYFRCGGELIALPEISQDHLPEILDLLQTQHQYYMTHL